MYSHSFVQQRAKGIPIHCRRFERERRSKRLRDEGKKYNNATGRHLRVVKELATTMENGDPIIEVIKEITSEQVLLYAEASGDFNPIHVNKEFAENSQFGRNIAHGMMIAATISESMSLTFGESWHHSGKVKIRFRSPAYPGDTVTTSGQIQKMIASEEGTEIKCSVLVTNQTGETLISGSSSVIILS